MMRTIGVIVLAAFVLFLAYQIYFFGQKGRVAQREYDALHAEFQDTERRYQSIQSDFVYYLNPKNLEKELRARFNYRAIGEKMIIIVPRQASGTQPQ